MKYFESKTKGFMFFFMVPPDLFRLCVGGADSLFGGGADTLKGPRSWTRSPAERHTRSGRMWLLEVFVPFVRLYLCGFKVIVYQMFHRSFTLPGEERLCFCKCLYVCPTRALTSSEICLMHSLPDSNREI